MIAARAFIILFGCVSCAPTSSLYSLPQPLDAILDAPDPLAEGLVSVTGKIYPAARNSILLGRKSYVLEGDDEIPPPTECIHLLASQDQYERLRGNAGNLVTVYGELRLIDQSPDPVPSSCKSPSKAEELTPTANTPAQRFPSSCCETGRYLS